MGGLFASGKIIVDGLVRAAAHAVLLGCAPILARLSTTPMQVMPQVVPRHSAINAISCRPVFNSQAGALEWYHDGGIIMERAKLAQMSVDELWTLHLEISDALLLLKERLNQVRAPRIRARAEPSVLRKITQS
jgi:hypothetical protein